MKQLQPITALFLLSLSLIGRSTSAQPTKAPVVFEAVNYTRQLPTLVRRTVPHAGTTRFWGLTPRKYQEHPMWIHVYDVQKTDFSAKFTAKDYAPVDYGKDPGDGVQKSACDLWFQDENKRWQRISHVGFEYLRFGYYEEERRVGELERVAVKTFWLNVKTKTQPIFQIDFINQNAWIGWSYTHLWVIFSQGVDKKPVVQAFQTASSSLDSWNFEVISTDQIGNLLVKYFHSSYQNGTLKWTLKWNGQRFAREGRHPLTEEVGNQ